jgi:phenylalanyl-tRNA synthetase beta chain
MKISMQWLQEFLDISEEPAQVGDRLTLVGLAVDGLETLSNDTILELDITANRGDCLSHLGVARELAAVYDLDIRHPETAVEENSTAVEDTFAISIADPVLCRRYCGRYISGVTIGPSPEWLVERLEAVGVRSINNVADITNYVLMELGHPLHAFDADTLKGSQIVVRRAESGETIRTLDGEERKLDDSMLVIADAERAVALAGIMGGLETEISEKTTNVLLESAWFDPISVRKTGKSVNLGSEASYRFERGADIEMAATALERTTRMIAELAGGEAHRGVIDVYPGRADPGTISLRRDRIAQHLGGDVPDADVDRVFRRLGFNPAPSANDGWTITVPSHRHDLGREEDLLEEVARHYGYDRFPSTMPSWSGQGRHLDHHAEETSLRDVLAALGYSETCSIAFGNSDTQEVFAQGVKPVAIQNPLSEDAPVLRTSLVPSVLGSIQWNLNRGLRDLALYEIAKIYPKSGESRRLVMATTGAARPQTIHEGRTETDFYRLKGEVERLLSRFKIDLEESAGDVPSYFHPGRSVRLGPVASVGELHTECETRFKLRQKTYVAEIDIEEVLRAGLKNIAAAPIPKYPAVRRDLSLLIDRKTPYGEVVRAVGLAGIPELIEVSPFDRLDRGPFPESCYSLAVTLVFQSAERTLTDSEVQGFEQRILAELGEVGVELRS